jgi:hypothetical protein
MIISNNADDYNNNAIEQRARRAAKRIGLIAKKSAGVPVQSITAAVSCSSSPTAMAWSADLAST